MQAGGNRHTEQELHGNETVRMASGLGNITSNTCGSSRNGSGSPQWSDPGKTIISSFK